ncbi:DNA polymerase III subunit beta [Coprothermobacteraceae bacterium]|nr:DNA polymerase III subunit beta [Coprothermobacteraceae bacterium]
MEIIVAKEDLIQALEAVLKHVPKKTTQPILYNILLEVGDGTLKITGTDMRSALSYKIAVQSSESFATTVPAKYFAEFVKKAPASDVALDFVKNHLLVSSGTASLKLSTMAPSEYPTLEVVEGTTFSISTGKLKEAVDAVKKNVSKGELRNPVLEGIYFDGTEGKLALVATDGHRLAAKYTDLEVTESACLPADVISDITDTLADTGDTAYIVFGEGEVGFENETVYAVVRTLEGQFPAWRSVIPKTVETKVVAPKALFEQILDRASMLSKTYDDAVRLAFDDGAMTVSADVPDLGSYAETVPVEKEGPDLKIACNYAYLQDVLSGFKDESVFIGLTSSLHPILVKPASEEGYIGLVMPMKL